MIKNLTKKYINIFIVLIMFLFLIVFGISAFFSIDNSKREDNYNEITYIEPIETKTVGINPRSEDVYIDTSTFEVTSVSYEYIEFTIDITYGDGVVYDNFYPNDLSLLSKGSYLNTSYLGSENLSINGSTSRKDKFYYHVSGLKPNTKYSDLSINYNPPGEISLEDVSIPSSSNFQTLARPVIIDANSFNIYNSISRNASITIDVTSGDGTGEYEVFEPEFLLLWSGNDILTLLFKEENLISDNGNDFTKTYTYEVTNLVPGKEYTDLSLIYNGQEIKVSGSIILDLEYPIIDAKTFSIKTVGSTSVSFEVDVKSGDGSVGALSPFVPSKLILQSNGNPIGTTTPEGNGEPINPIPDGSGNTIGTYSFVVNDLETSTTYSNLSLKYDDSNDINIPGGVSFKTKDTPIIIHMDESKILSTGFDNSYFEIEVTAGDGSNTSYESFEKDNLSLIDLNDLNELEIECISEKENTDIENIPGQVTKTYVYEVSNLQEATTYDHLALNYLGEEISLDDWVIKTLNYSTDDVFIDPSSFYIMENDISSIEFSIDMYFNSNQINPTKLVDDSLTILSENQPIGQSYCSDFYSYGDTYGRTTFIYSLENLEPEKEYTNLSLELFDFTKNSELISETYLPKETTIKTKELIPIDKNTFEISNLSSSSFEFNITENSYTEFGSGYSFEEDSLYLTSNGQQLETNYLKSQYENGDKINEYEVINLDSSTTYDNIEIHYSYLIYGTEHNKSTSITNPIKTKINIISIIILIVIIIVILLFMLLILKLFGSSKLRFKVVTKWHDRGAVIISVNKKPSWLGERINHLYLVDEFSNYLDFSVVSNGPGVKVKKNQTLIEIRGITPGIKYKNLSFIDNEFYLWKKAYGKVIL